MNPNVSGVSETSPINSPCKPLNVDNKTEKEGRSEDNERAEIEAKDFNSSSDTCVSEKFDHSPSKSIMKTSPTKSQDPNKASPKKTVGFRPNLDTVHAYSPQTEDATSPQPLEMDSPRSPVSHVWNDVSQSSVAPESPAPAPPPHSVDTITGLLTNEISDLSNFLFSNSPRTSKEMSFGDKMSLNDKLDVFLGTKSHNNQDDMEQHLDKLTRATNNETEVNIMALSHDLEPHVAYHEKPLDALAKTHDIYLNSSHSSQSSLQSLLDSNRQLQAASVDHSSRGTQVQDGIKGFSDDLATYLFPYTNESAGLEESGDLDESLEESLDFERGLELQGKNRSGSSVQEQGNKGDLDPNPQNSNPESNNYIQKMHSLQDDHQDDPLSQSARRNANNASQGADSALSHASSHLYEQSYQSTEKSIMNLLNSASLFEVRSIPHAQELPLLSIPKPNLQSVHSLTPEDDPDYFGVKQEHSQPLKMDPGSCTDSEFSWRQPKVNDEVESNKDTEVKVELKTEDFGEAVSHVKTESDLDLDSGFDNSDVSDSEDSDGDSDGDSDSHGVKDETNQSLGEMRENEVSIKKSFSQNSLESSGSDTSFTPTLETRHHGLREELENAQNFKISEFQNHNFEPKTLAPQPQIQSTGTELNRSESDASALANSSNTSVLANSSNINPPLNMRLPSLDLQDSSFADFNKKINANADSYEESLSAEHDEVKQNLNFISIWRSQHLRKRSNSNTVISNGSSHPVQRAPLRYNTEERNKYPIPISLRTRKFKDVNLISSKVVNKTYEDLNVSSFLPEISQDSNFEGHFNSLLKVSDSTFFDRESNLSRLASLKSRRHSLGSSNVLHEALGNRAFKIDERTTDPKYRDKSRSTSSRASSRNTPKITPKDTPMGNTPMKTTPNGSTYGSSYGGSAGVKRSKFYVPSFEIKRSNSILSPKNQYNDIFNDSLEKPTITAKGMKTLPSMDKDDIQRIMKMKKTMTQDEYSRLKIVGGSTVSAAHQSTENNDTSSRKASISDTMGSEMSQRLNVDLKNEKVLFPDPDLDMSSVEMALQPVRRRSSNNPFRRDQPASRTVSTSVNANVLERASEPPVTPVTEKADVAERTDNGKEKTDKGKEGRRGSPIKLGSPMRLVHNNGSVTGVFLAKKPSFDISKSENNDNGQISDKKLDSERNMDRNLGHEQNVEADLRANPMVNQTIDELSNPKVRDHKNGLSTITISSNYQISHGEHRAVYHSIAKGISKGTVKKVNVDEEKAKMRELIEKERQKSLNKSLDKKSLEKDRNLEKSSDKSLKSSEVGKSLEVDSRVSGSIMERGKLFFRVLDVINIMVPELNKRKAKFNITLDNGVHCIKTPDYNMNDKQVSINKEFELVASSENSLQFIITMKANYEKAVMGYKEVNERKVVRSKTKLGRLFGSKEVITTSKFIPSNNKDPYDNIFAMDGSFARCYIDLDNYEDQITGRAQTFRLQCFNEWGDLGKRQPYAICQLEVKMLYIPKMKEYEVLPRSIKAAYENLQDLKHEKHLRVEGYLHQEGGDCEAWKKRWFRLEGTSLVAHSEFSKKTRAKINLEKVVDIIFVDRENMAKSSGNYRNFSDIFLMENMFKIRFANGEIIDFGASSKNDKNMWIEAIQEIVYRNKFRRLSWVKLMQERN